MNKRFGAWVALALGVLAASPAHAVTIYGEILTSQQSFLLPGNIGARGAFEVGFDPLDIDLLEWNVQPGAGLGDGFVSAAVSLTGSGGPLQYTHTFDLPGYQLEEAWLYVAIGDNDWAQETAAIYLDRRFWNRGQFRVGRLFTGPEVSVHLVDGELDVEIRSAEGNGFTVLASALKARVRRSSDTGHPVPEPGAVLLFSISALLVGGALRRRA